MTAAHAKNVFSSGSFWKWIPWLHRWLSEEYHLQVSSINLQMLFSQICFSEDYKLSTLFGDSEARAGFGERGD